MALRSVRIYYYPTTKKRELWLTSNYWGFSEWFDRRLKERRELLRGIEVKGIDIVNLSIYEDESRAWIPNVWKRRGNTLEFTFVADLSPLEHGDKIANIELLMGFYAHLARHAAWPQMQAVADALSESLTTSDKSDLLPYLQWPRQVGSTAKYLA